MALYLASPSFPGNILYCQGERGEGIDSNILHSQHIWQWETEQPSCHSERKRRISCVGHRDSSLPLRMTQVSISEWQAPGRRIGHCSTISSPVDHQGWTTHHPHLRN